MKIIIDNRSKVSNSTAMMLIEQHVDTITKDTRSCGWISSYGVYISFIFNKKSIRFVITNYSENG
jgi:uncharacterized alpha/beta hydrolase family protein